MSVILIKAGEDCGISGAIAWHNEGGTVAYQGRLCGITGAESSSGNLKKDGISVL